MRVGQLGLDLLVFDDAALLQIDQQHAAGLQAPLLDDAVLRDRQRAGLGRQDHHVVVGDQVACRAQPVAIQRGADLSAVGEGHGGRAVPGLHQGGVVFIEGAPRLVHVGVLLPGLRDHDHHGVGQGIARHDQQFQAVVEGGGVGLAFVDDGVELGQVFAQHGRAHRALAGAQPVEVALDGVDLAIVGDHAVGVRERPGRECIGGEALVHQRQGRDGPGVGQVAVVQPHLIGQQQAFVDHGAHRDRGHEIFLSVRELHALDGVAGGLADDVEFALQRVGHHDVVPAADEELTDDGFAGAHGGRHFHVAVDGHVAPAEHDLAFVAHGALQFALTGQARRGLLGQEHHGHAVVVGLRQGDALGGHFLAVELIGDLDENPRAVAHQLIGADGAPVVQVFQDLQGLLDDGMALVPLDVGDETDAAGIVFLFGAVETLGGRQAGGTGGGVGHDGTREAGYGCRSERQKMEITAPSPC